MILKFSNNIFFLKKNLLKYISNIIIFKDEIDNGDTINVHGIMEKVTVASSIHSSNADDAKIPVGADDITNRKNNDSDDGSNDSDTLISIERDNDSKHCLCSVNDCENY